MKKLILNLLMKLLKLFDKESYNLYNRVTALKGEVAYKLTSKDTQVKLIESMIIDGARNNKFDLSELHKLYGIGCLKGIYEILNNFYISELSIMIYEGKADEIIKLKYLQTIIIDIKNFINTNE